MATNSSQSWGISTIRSHTARNPVRMSRQQKHLFHVKHICCEYVLAQLLGARFTCHAAVSASRGLCQVWFQALGLATCFT